jgi:hypothetical protein
MSKAAKMLLLATKAVLVVVLLSIGTKWGNAREKYETIDAQAFGTSTQLGQNIGITVIIYQFSTAADRQILVEAFQKGSNQGLVNALSKMPAVGRISITGTLGYDLSFIRLIQTPTGRQIRFVTNRQIRFGEAYFDTQSQAFNLTAGMIDLNDQDKNKSSGVLYPAAQLTIDKEGQLSFELNQNPWRLGGIIDWAGTPGAN